MLSVIAHLTSLVFVGLTAYLLFTLVRDRSEPPFAWVMEVWGIAGVLTVLFFLMR